MLYKQKNSEIWWSDLRHNGRRVRQTTGELDKSKAQDRENEFQITLWRAGPAPSSNTWSQAVTTWTNVERRSDSELYSLVKFAKNFADRELSSITPEDIDKALSFCKTAGTYTRYRNMISAILQLSGIKLSLMKRRDKKQKPRKYITPEEWTALHVELPSHLQAMATFAIETGLRQSNVFSLQWSRVDLDRRVVLVDAHDAKADKPIRVPLNERAYNVLVAQKNLPAYVPCRSRLKHTNGVPVAASTFVFLYRGKPVANVTTAFNSACERAGLGKYNNGRYTGFTWHGFRHTWATWHAKNGTPLGVLKALGAWSDLRMVENYAQYMPSHIDSFADNTKPKQKAKK